MIGTPFRVVPYTAEHRDEVASLRQSIFGSDLRTNRQYIMWKYEQNPYVRDALYLVKRNDSLVGMRGLFGARWEVGSGGQQVIAPNMADTAIHPDHREGGEVFSMLGRYMAEDLRRRGIRWFTNLSSSPANYVATKLDLGLRFFGSGHPIRRGESADNLQRAGARLATRLPATGAALRIAHGAWTQSVRAISAAGYLWKRHEETDLGTVTLSSMLRAQEMAEVADQQPTSRIRHVRNAEYFSWRYRNPLSKYQFLYTGRPRMDGYAVIQRYPGGSLVRIVDFAGASEDPLDRIFSAVVDSDRWAQAVMWSDTVTPAIRERLLAGGFKTIEASRKTRTGFLVGQVSPERPEDVDWTVSGMPLDQPSSWEMQMIFSDAY